MPTELLSILVSIEIPVLILRQEQNIFGQIDGLTIRWGLRGQKISIRAKNRSAGLDSSVSLPRKQGRDHISSRPTAKRLHPVHDHLKDGSFRVVERCRS